MQDFLEGGKFNKFVVIKQDDIREYLTEIGQSRLQDMLKYIGSMRKQEGKNPHNQYLVINIDEPYAHEIVNILKKNGHWG